jgi:hypothetical protein
MKRPRILQLNGYFSFRWSEYEFQRKLSETKYSQYDMHPEPSAQLRFEYLQFIGYDAQSQRGTRLFVPLKFVVPSSRRKGIFTSVCESPRSTGLCIQQQACLWLVIGPFNSLLLGLVEIIRLAGVPVTRSYLVL